MATGDKIGEHGGLKIVADGKRVSSLKGIHKGPMSCSNVHTEANTKNLWGTKVNKLSDAVL